MDRKLLVALALTAIWFVAAASCSGEPEGASSPQAVAKAVTRAMDKGAYADLLPLIAPRDRDFVVAAIFLVVAVTTKSEEEISALEQRHGLDSKKRGGLRLSNSKEKMRDAAARWLGDVDRTAFFADCMKMLKNNGRATIPSGKLTDLKLDGDSGSAKLGGRPVLFVRERGKWFITMPQN